MPTPRQISWLLAAIVCLCLNTLAIGCPNCKEAVSLQPEEAARMSNGYNWSVLFMLVVPFSMFSTGALLVRRAAKKGMFPEF